MLYFLNFSCQIEWRYSNNHLQKPLPLVWSAAFWFWIPYVIPFLTLKKRYSISEMHFQQASTGHFRKGVYLFFFFFVPSSSSVMLDPIIKLLGQRRVHEEIILFISCPQNYMHCLRVRCLFYLMENFQFEIFLAAVWSHYHMSFLTRTQRFSFFTFYFWWSWVLLYVYYLALFHSLNYIGLDFIPWPFLNQQ